MAAKPRNESPDQDTSAPAEGSSPAEDFAPSSDPPKMEEEDAVAKLRAEKKHLTEQLQRLHAEFDNFRKRSQREKDDFLQYTLFDAVKSLLPVLDGFELALGSNGGGEEYRKGVELIYQQLWNVLQKMGLKKVEALGQQFDPTRHQAVATMETEKIPDHEIVDELQKGYFFKDRLLRPAMVQVARNTTGRLRQQENGFPE